MQRWQETQWVQIKLWQARMKGMVVKHWMRQPRVVVEFLCWDKSCHEFIHDGAVHGRIWEEESGLGCYRAVFVSGS